MKIRSTIFLFLVAVVAIPQLVMAQAYLQSSQYKLDTITLGDSFNILSGVTGFPPVISGVGEQSISDKQFTVTWNTDKLADSYVEYGATASYGQGTKVDQPVTSHIVTVTGLTQKTLYHFRVKSTDSGKNTSVSGDYTVRTLAVTGINSVQVTNVTYTGATITWSTATPTSQELDYGTTSSYDQSDKGPANSYATNHTVTLANLTDGTTYHFRILAVDANGQTYRTDDLLFATIAKPICIDCSPPIPTPVTSGGGGNEATSTIVTNTPTTIVAKYFCAYDPTNVQTIRLDNYATVHQLKLVNLLSDCLYTLTITATDMGGYVFTFPVQTFTTPPNTNPPKISDLKTMVGSAQNGLTVTITWKTNELSTTEGKLESLDNPNQTTNVSANKDLTTNHIVVKGRLDASSSYKFTANSTDKWNLSNSQAISFTTPASHADIFTAIFDAMLRAFSWVGRAFGGSSS